MIFVEGKTYFQYFCSEVYILIHKSEHFETDIIDYKYSG